MKTDVAIVGGGPAGAASAMFLLRAGVKPLIVEQETFPRYHIGESLTGAGGAVLRDLGLENEMYGAKHPVKQGVNVFCPAEEDTWFVPVTARDPDWRLVDTDTWQVRRSLFDQMLLDQAVAREATLVRGKAVAPLRGEGGSVRGVQVSMADGGELADIESEVLLDCSGQATWLARSGGVTGPRSHGPYEKQIAIVSQAARVVRGDGGTRESHGDNTLIFYREKYHWAWAIPLDAEVVSVGVVVPAAYFTGKKEGRRDFLLREMREMHPDLEQRLHEVELVEDVHVIPNYSYRVPEFCGRGFLCIGDAHRFVDPIFSFGVTVALREAQFAAPLVVEYLAGRGRDRANPFAGHQRSCEQAIDVLEDMMGAFWQDPTAFAVLARSQHREELTDVFAGRVFEHQPSAAVLEFRALLERQRGRASTAGRSGAVGARAHLAGAPRPVTVLAATARAAATSAPAKIKVVGLSKWFFGDKGRVDVLDDIGLEVRQGEFLAVVGPSGCGKSTLLNCIAGFEPASRGFVEIDGERVTGTSRRRVFVFQEPAIFPWLTVAQNIGFGLRKLPAAERRRIVDEHVRLVGLQGFEKAYPNELSGGMKQRVEFARALAVGPTVLFLDEPFGALDAFTRLEMRREIVRIWQETKKTCLLVTHDVEEATELSDRIALMTKRPARIAEILDNPLPRPRDSDDAGFRAIKDHIYGILGVERRV